MRMVPVVVSLFLGVWCLVGCSQTAPGGERVAVQTKPLAVLTGADSRVNKPAYYRITSDDAWRKLLQHHQGTSGADVYSGSLPALDIDFNQCMVIAVFQGDKTNSRGLTISLEEGIATLAVRFDDMSYQTLGGAVRVAPYAFVVVSKSAKLVVVEEDVQALKTNPPEWKERARLEAR